MKTEEILEKYKQEIDTKEKRSAVRKALTAMDFEQMIDFVLLSAVSGFKDGMVAVVNELKDE